MKKVNALFILAFLIIGTSGFAMATTDDGYCQRKDLSFLRQVITRVKDSNLDQADKNLIFQRIIDYLSHRGEDNHIYWQNLIFTIRDRVKDSNMPQEQKNLIFQRLRFAYNQHC